MRSSHTVSLIPRNLRKALLDNTVKVLKLHHGKMTITMLVADTREYSTARSSGTAAVMSSAADIQLTLEGRAPTTPEWTLTAIGTGDIMGMVRCQ